MDDRSFLHPAWRFGLRALVRIPVVLAIGLAPALQAGHRPHARVQRVAALLQASRNDAAERRLRWERIRREMAQGRLLVGHADEQGPGNFLPTA
jgi:hypothetical protein